MKSKTSTKENRDDMIRRSNSKAIKRMIKARESELKAIILTFTEKLNKKQTTTLIKSENRQVLKFNEILSRLGLDVGYDKNCVTFLVWKLNYVKYTLLKMKRPKVKKPSKALSTVPVFMGYAQTVSWGETWGYG